jgi:hypothetical protein
MDLDEDSLRAAFDRVADSIERTARENPVNAWMRKVSREALITVLPAGPSLLEIGCGTGADSVFLADRGFRVASSRPPAARTRPAEQVRSAVRTSPGGVASDRWR